MQLLPGKTFSNVADKANYESAKETVLTLPELERWLTLEIAGVYHHSLHRALRTSPTAAWEFGLTRPLP